VKRCVSVTPRVDLLLMNVQGSHCAKLATESTHRCGVCMFFRARLSDCEAKQPQGHSCRNSCQHKAKRAGHGEKKLRAKARSGGERGRRRLQREPANNTRTAPVHDLTCVSTIRELPFAKAHDHAHRACCACA
jgi:hypothetical protein